MAPSADVKPVLSSLGIPNGHHDSSDTSNGKVVSPTDSDNAEKNIAALDAQMNTKLQIANEPAAKSAFINDPGTSSDYACDPLSATALTSPLHSINWDTIQSGSLDSIANGFPNSWETSNTSLWESFKRTGPRYPPSLEKLILDYHHRHSRSWQLAHDMGAGSGVYSPVLARYFRHVHVSDPNPAGLASSRHLLSSWAAANRKSRGRFTFSNSKAEQGHEAVADGTVDMAMMMEGAHFTNPGEMVRRAAQTLAKDGTLALVSYNPACRVTGNARANDAVQSLFAAWGAQPWDVVCGEARSKKNFSRGLDFVPLPEDLFEQSRTRRITINNTTDAFAEIPGATTPVHDDGERYSSDDNNDDVAKGWRQEVGPEFFRSLTSALVGPGAVQQFEGYLREIQRVVQETSPNGIMVNIEWTVAVVLATRK